MPIPDVLKTFVGLLRTEVQSAHDRNSTLRTNAATYTDSIRPYVQMTPAIDAALTKAKIESQDLAKKLSFISISSTEPNPEIDRARQRALVALDALEAALVSAKSTGHLGYNW